MHSLCAALKCLICTVKNVISIGYSPVWRQLLAYNTREIIGRGRSLRQLSQGCYIPIIGYIYIYMYFIPW